MATILLSDHQIDLWYTPQGVAADRGLLEEYGSLITADEAARQRRFVFDKDREQFLLARALVRCVLSRYADVPPAEWRFGQNDFGKPAIDRPAPPPQLAFNLSHTQGLVVCAVAKARSVGVDVEAIDRDVEHLTIAERFFAEPECRYLREATADERGRAFFRIWTLKEAYIKAHGKGLSIPLGSFAVVPTDDQPPSLEMRDDSSVDASEWKFAQLEMAGQFVIGTCAQRIASAAMDVVVREMVPLREAKELSILRVDRGLLTI
jgi:4'-phosphopantetheinyl transferase